MGKLILLPVLASLLVFCVGSPIHTSSMNSTAIQSVDNFTLCKAYTPREAYSPSATVRNEVRRRGLNCGGIYTYTGTGALDAAANVLRGVQVQQGGTRSAPVSLTSRCTRMGDTSGQVYTFSRIACPVGYAPAL